MSKLCLWTIHRHVIFHTTKRVSTIETPFFFLQCAAFVFDVLHDAGLSGAAVKSVLLSEHVSLHDKAVEELQRMEQVESRFLQNDPLNEAR